MLINWKGDGKSDRILTCPAIDTEYTGALVAKDDLVVLIPGWNEIDDDSFKKIYPHIRYLIEAGQIEFYCRRENGEDGAVTFVGQPLRDIRADKARDIVKGCFNMTNLKEWIEDMKITTEIRHLIDRQIEDIQNYGEETARTNRRY